MIKYADELTELDLDYFLESLSEELKYYPSNDFLTRVLTLRDEILRKNLWLVPFLYDNRGVQPHSQGF